ncbi:MAG: efflux RND transporter periplasmic adaptor subunit [Pirellulales bacterium]|nr:efflux RND transporter periplasmic adaptor subunit [Pirellulales bacterium]
MRFNVRKIALFTGLGLLILLVGGSLGYLIAGSADTGSAVNSSTDNAASIWTCSMHPQIKLPKPGKCPICFMDLIPLKAGSEDNAAPRQLTLTPRAVGLAEIQTTPVRREYATRELRLVGKVAYDETRVADITAWVGGRLQRLFVDYTGISVRKGDHLVSLYSPDLIVAQKELLQNVKSNGDSDNRDRQLTASMLESSREKLRLLGVMPEQIDEIVKRGTPSDYLTIYSPIGGIVIEKLANEGAYVKTGTKIYTIADLTTVWVNLDAYESDLPWLRYGQQVEFTTESFPGEIFKGRIAFIEPILDNKTRSVKVRVNVPNPDGKLKPGMFVRAVVRSRLAAGGIVFDTSLIGKWISPMHPEIVKDAPGKCDICGMDLVPAEKLGYPVPKKIPLPPLVIPASAPLITGKRAVVYVRLPNTDKPTFEGREVLLGERAGDKYIVRKGLKEGELVVTKGNFKLDSSLQIQARPSMMNPGDTMSADGKKTGASPGEKEKLDVSDEFRRQLDALYKIYLKLQIALSDDRIEDANAAFAELPAAFKSPNAALLEGRALDAWLAAQAKLQGAFEGNSNKIGAEELRKRFEGIAGAMLDVTDSFGHTQDVTLYRAFCPMAFKNKGAAWLQSGKTIANPYFGHKMLRCGEIQQEFQPVVAHQPTQSGTSVEIKPKDATEEETRP